MMPNSAHFTAMATLRLLNRSAKKPPAMENKTNGTAKMVPTNPTRAWRFSCDKPRPRMKNVTRSFRVLSLKAF